MADTAVQIREQLADQIGPQRFSIWFKHSTQFDVADGLLNIGVPNQFVGTWIGCQGTDRGRQERAAICDPPVSQTVEAGLVR